MLSDAQFGRLLELYDLDWQGYRKVRKGVKKRLRRHMQESGCRHFEQYWAALAKNPTLTRECRLRLTVSISRFFRDPALWQALEQQVLPSLAQEQTIGAWCGGCGRGEEAYSLALLHEAPAGRSDLPPLNLLASDLNPAYLAQARAGEYNASSLKALPDRFRPYFHKVPGKRAYVLDARIRRAVGWQENDLLGPPPAGPFHMIFLRNSLLTYLRPAKRPLRLVRILGALRPQGFLIIGATEKLPIEIRGVKPYGSGPGLYRYDIDI